MAENSIEKRLINVICNQLGLMEDEVKLTSLIIDDLGADSLDIVELTMAAEDEFGVSISDEEVDSVKTVADAVKVVENAPKW